MKLITKILICIISIILILLTILYSKNKKTICDQYGIKYNTERIKRNIPIVTSEMHCRISNKKIRWIFKKNINNTENTNKAFYGGKLIEIENDKIITETDIYYSGKVYVDNSFHEAPYSKERLEFEYSYNNEEKGVSPWNIIYRTTNFPEISFQKAEKLIQSWGINRLNY